MLKKVAIVFSLLVLLETHSLAEETWKIASLNWEPYASAEMTTQGNSVQKLRELLSKVKIRLIVEFYPWKRAQTMAKRKEFVGYFPAWPEEVYEGFTASSTVDWSEVGILKQSEDIFNFDGIDDLFRAYRVGLIATYAYPQIVDHAARKFPAHTDKAPNELSLLKKLSKGRCAAAITDPTVMMYLAEKNGIYNIEVVKIIMHKELVVAFRDDADNRGRMQILENVLKASGPSTRH